MILWLGEYCKTQCTFTTLLLSAKKNQPISINQAKLTASFLAGRPSASEQWLVHGGEPETMFPQAFDTQHQLFVSSRSLLLPGYSSGCFCSSEYSHWAAWQGQEASGMRDILGHVAHNLLLLKPWAWRPTLSCSPDSPPDQCHRGRAQQPGQSNWKAVISRLSLAWRGLPISAQAVHAPGSWGQSCRAEATQLS